MKKLLSVLIALLLVTAPVFAQEEAAQEPVRVTIFHTNDVHARYNHNAGMGYAMMASFVNEAKAADENVLVLDAGDTLHGTVFANYTGGSSIVDLMNQVGYDAMAAGNHDFNYGYAQLKELSTQANFPILSSTLRLEDGSYALTPYAILESGGKKIGVIGAQNPTMKEAIHPDQIDGLVFGGVEEVETVVKEITAQCDAIVILAHWGATDAYDPNSQVLAAIEGVDLVIDGHSHTLLSDIAQVPGNAPITSTGEYLNNLGKVVLTFGEEGVTCETSLIPNPGRFEDWSMISGIQALESEQSAVLDQQVGESKVDLMGEREIVRTQESNWGNLACDIFIAETKADIALMNGGNIRQSVAAGPLTIRDINNTFPFGNLVCLIEIDGASLKAALEHGVSNLPETSGGFPQIGGMTMVIDASKPVGERVVELNVGGSAYDPAAKYTLVTNDYLAAGGDGYEMLAACPLLLETNFMDEVIVGFIKAQGTVAPALDGRIQIING